MISKKAQSEIITTVLIILLVLAAIVIVWQVVNSTLGKAKTGVDEKSQCLDSIFTVTSAVAGTDIITIKRESGISGSNAAPVTSIKVYKAGADISSLCTGYVAGTGFVTITNILVGSTGTVTCATAPGVAAGDLISVAGVMGTAVCSESGRVAAS
jgi:flagellin-like protein